MINGNFPFLVTFPSRFKVKQIKKIFFPKTKTVKLIATAQLEHVSQPGEADKTGGRCEKPPEWAGCLFNQIRMWTSTKAPPPNSPKQNIAPGEVNALN